MSWVRVDDVLDALLPPACVLCGGRLPDGVLCPGCAGDLPWFADPGDLGETPLPAGLAGASALLPYEYPVDRLIAAAKFGRQLPVARALGEILARHMPEIPGPDHVVPVPLHWHRQAERGFNQAEEMARALCRRRRWPLATRLCRRTRPTAAQAGLSAVERRDNLRQAFSATALPAGSRILLVDDVLTTGATAAAVAQVLMAAGAAEVRLWTLVRVRIESGSPAGGGDRLPSGELNQPLKV